MRCSPSLVKSADTVSDRADQVRRPARRLLPSASVYTACEDPEEREKETPLERLRRLRLEMAELEEEVRRGVAEKAKDGEGEVAGEEEAVGKDGKKEKKKREVSPAVILQQLQLLRRDLTGLTPSIEGTFEAEGEKEPGTDEEEGEKDGHHATKAKQSSGLLAKLGLASASTEAENGVVVSTRKTTSEGGAGAGDGELEKRIAELEKLVGASEADVDEVRLLLLSQSPFSSNRTCSCRRILSLLPSSRPSPASTTSSPSSPNHATSTRSPGASKSWSQISSGFTSRVENSATRGR